MGIKRNGSHDIAGAFVRCYLFLYGGGLAAGGDEAGVAQDGVLVHAHLLLVYLLLCLLQRLSVLEGSAGRSRRHFFFHDGYFLLGRLFLDL